MARLQQPLHHLVSTPPHVTLVVITRAPHHHGMKANPKATAHHLVGMEVHPKVVVVMAQVGMEDSVSLEAAALEVIPVILLAHTHRVRNHFDSGSSPISLHTQF